MVRATKTVVCLRGRCVLYVANGSNEGNDQSQSFIEPGVDDDEASGRSTQVGPRGNPPYNLISSGTATGRTRSPTGVRQASAS